MESIHELDEEKTEISSFKIAMKTLEQNYLHNSKPEEVLKLCNLFWNCENQTNKDKLMVLIIQLINYHKQKNKLLEKYVYQKIVKLLQKVHPELKVNYGVIYYIFLGLTALNGNIEIITSKCFYNTKKIPMKKHYKEYKAHIIYRKEKSSLRKSKKHINIYFISDTFLEKVKYYNNVEEVDSNIDCFDLHNIKHSWNAYIPFLDYEERKDYKRLYNLSQNKENKFIYISENNWGRIDELFVKDVNYKYQLQSKKVLLLNEEIKKINPSLIKPIYINYPNKCKLENFEDILYYSVKKEIPNFDISSNNIYYYKLNIASIKRKKQIIFNIICSYLYMSTVSLDENQVDLLDKTKTEKELENKNLLIICIGKGPSIYINNSLLYEIYKKHYQSYTKNTKQNKLLLNRKRLINENGLKNLGSTCYMNSGLQCILHCDYFINYLLNFYQKDKFNNDDQSITIELIKVLNQMKANKKSVIIIQELRKEFVQKEPKFKKRIQYDSPEFITDFLNQLNIELNRSNHLDPYNNEGKNLNWIKFIKKENSIITDLFYGQLQNQYYCKNCKTFKHFNERFLLFQIPVASLTPIKVINVENKEIIEYIEKYQEYNVIQIKKLLSHKYPYIDVVKIDNKEETIEFLKDNQHIYYHELSKIIVYIKPEENAFSGYIVPFTLIKTGYFLWKETKVEILYNFYPKREDIYANKEKTQINPILSNCFCYTNNAFYSCNEGFPIQMNNTILYGDKSTFSFTKMTNNIDPIHQIEFIRRYTNNKEIKTKCEMCKSSLELKITINVLPKYLCMYFKRYYYNSASKLEKDEQMIDYDETINIYEFVDQSSSITKEECEYELFGVNVHKGSINFGHYYAKCKVEDKWFKCDDNLVKEIDSNEYKDKDALILFYKQKNISEIQI